MTTQEPPLGLAFAAELRLFLAPSNRAGAVSVACDGTSSLGHVVESAGVRLPEVGLLRVNDRSADPSYQPRPGDRRRTSPRPRRHSHPRS